MLRQALASRRRGDAPARRMALLAGQVLLAALLWPVLWPPSRPGTDATLVVLTASAPRPPLGSHDDHVALPEAPAHAGIARVPDLGTALRRRPQTRTLLVVGDGLPARDRDAARGLRIRFEPGAAPTGIVALQAPARVVAGRRFGVSGRVDGGGGDRLELLDPGGRRVDLQPAAEDGRFSLTAVAGPAGRSAWTLQRRAADDTVAETLALPVDVVAGAPLRVLAIAGGVNPEQKYLHRWALDAGLALHSRASVGAGVDIGTPTPTLDTEGLREVDLLILDDRAWRGLGDGGRAALREAVRDGVGVLLRLTSDPSEADLDALQTWGFELAGADVPRSVELPGTDRADAPAGDAMPEATPDGADAAEAHAGNRVDAEAGGRGAVVLSRRAWSVSAADGAPLLHDAAGDVLAVWRAEGRGRIAVWNIADTFRLRLAGRGAAYDSLWAGAAGRLARARDGAARPPSPADARVGGRVVLCDLGDGPTLRGPDGGTIPLVVDPASGTRRCAAAWPTQAGWHEWRDAEGAGAFVVRGADEGVGLARTATRDATRALGARATGLAAEMAAPVPGARWPWLLAWLLAAAALWALERSRAGRGN